MGIRNAGGPAGQREIARYLGISQATVCRVLGGKRSVTPALREAVLRAVEEFGYTPNRLGRNLARQSSSTIGIVTTSLVRPYFAQAIHGAQEAAARRGYYTMTCTTDGRPEREEQILELLGGRMVDGLIFVSASGNRRNAHIARFRRTNPNIVLVNRVAADVQIDTVLLDNEGGMRAATEHLLDLGHRSIGILAYAVGRSATERLAGYRAALAARDLPPGPEEILGAFDDVQVAQDAAARMLAAPRPPTAIVTVGDAMAVGVYRAAARAGMRIPRDLSVVAWEDFGYGTAMDPPLSTVMPPWQEAGRFATDLLLQRLARPDAATARIVFSCPLRLAESTAAPSR